MNSAPSRGRLRGNGCKGDSTVAARQSSDEAISAPLHGFDVTRILRQSPSARRSLLTTAFKPCSKVDKRPVAPNRVAQLLAGNHFPGMLEQDQKNLKWLAGQADADAAPAQFTRGRIEFERSERNASR